MLMEGSSMGFGEGGVGTSCVEGCSFFCELSGVGSIRFTLGILGKEEPMPQTMWKEGRMVGEMEEEGC